MLINNPESLKSWLVVVLEPLCEADSSALARYVLALLKKDKPTKDLKKVMIEQLDVFLSAETKPFVERLFDAIASEEYLTASAIAPPNTAEDTTINTVTIDSSNILNDVLNDDALEIKTEELELPLGSIDAITSIDIASTSAYKKDQTPPLDESKTKENNSHNKTSLDQIVAATANNSFKSSLASLSQPPALQADAHLRSASPPTKALADKENQPRESRRRRASLRSRSRSRSRSNERLSRRSRSRERRPNEREKNTRQFRNKSPPTMTHMTTDLRHDRRRGGGGGGGGLDRRRLGVAGGLADDRSPRFAAESRKPRNNRSNSRSRSPSIERGRGKVSPANNRTTHRGGGSAERHQHESEKRQRCRDFDEKGYCVRGETCPWDHGVNPVVFEGINNTALISMSLREYNPDAPDLWARSGGSAGIGGAADNGSAAAGGGINPFTGSARPGVMMGVPPVGVGFTHLGAAAAAAGGGGSGIGDKGANAAEYARTPGAAFRGAGTAMMPFSFNPAAITPLQRELIPIPVVDAGGNGGDISAMQQSKRRFELEDSVAIADGPTKRKIPLNSRLGPRPPNMQTNCSLELRKIPRGLNTIAHLNNHFAKFGKIVNIQVSYDGDPEAAIVTFSTHAEANVAYRSTEAVLNNRFIKVFWHNQELTAGGGGGGNAHNQELAAGGGRKNSQYHVNNVPAMPTPNSDSAKISNAATAAAAASQATSNNQAASAADVANADGTTAPATAGATLAATHLPPTSLRLKNNVARVVGVGGGVVNNAATNASIRKKQEEQAKAVLQLSNGLRKRKQELLQSYVKQMKSALELVERCEPTDPQRSKTFATIKILQETIEKLRKEIAAEQEQLQAQIQNQQPTSMPTPKQTKEQQKKELLDIELELFAQQQEGNDTSAIQKRLEELQRSLGIMSGSNVLTSAAAGGAQNKQQHFTPNRATVRPRPTFPEGSTRVDRRPKTIVVTGFTKDEADFVLGHFKHFGEITKHDVDKEIPQLILSYATRLNAEQAVLRGKLFKDKRLQIAWAPVIQPTPILATNALSDAAKQPAVAAKLDESKAVVAAVAAAVASASDIETTDTLPELRLEDEEEDEESEDRSWRR